MADDDRQQPDEDAEANAAREHAQAENERRSRAMTDAQRHRPGG